LSILSERRFGILTGVADKEVEVPRPTVRGGIRLSKPNRTVAFILGVAGLGAGGAAVFVTHLEAGPVGLMAVGLIFMIIAIGGILPTRLKIGENEATWETEREAAGSFVERVTDDAAPEEKPDVIEALDDLAEKAPDLAIRGMNVISYEQLIRQELAAAILELAEMTGSAGTVKLTTEVITGRREVDAVLERPDKGLIAIEVKYSTERLPPQWISRLHESFFGPGLRVPGDFVGLLLVTRTRLRPYLLEELLRYPQMRYVVYRGPEDGPLLRGTLREMLAA
jgi:hypothetical protein